MEGKIATVIGATGLIGGHLVDILGNDEAFSKVRVLVRRDVTYANTKIEVRVIDFSDEIAFRDGIKGSDAVFCAVGTTQKKVGGNRKEYRKVDYDIPVNAARFCYETGCPVFLVVSSVGASSSVKNFYLRLKGEMEEAVRKTNVVSISVFRPSMLVGERKEHRFGEDSAKFLSLLFSFMIPEKYKPVQAFEVANAMIEAAKLKKPGFHIYHYREIKTFISR